MRGGGLVTINGAEEGSFKNRWVNSDSQFSIGGFLGSGIEFKMYGQTTVSPMVGYEIFHWNIKLMAKMITQVC